VTGELNKFVHLLYFLWIKFPTLVGLLRCVVDLGAAQARVVWTAYTFTNDLGWAAGNKFTTIWVALLKCTHLFRFVMLLPDGKAMCT
jgi:hypothetical protein